MVLPGEFVGFIRLWMWFGFVCCLVFYLVFCFALFVDLLLIARLIG